MILYSYNLIQNSATEDSTVYVFVLDKNHIKSKIMRYLIIYNLCVQCKLYLLHVLFSIMGEKNGLPKNGNIFFCPKHCATIRFY